MCFKDKNITPVSKLALFLYDKLHLKDFDIFVYVELIFRLFFSIFE